MSGIPAEQLHRLDLGRLGRAVLVIQFHESHLAAAVEMPRGVVRRDRRYVLRWVGSIFRKLDPDPRGLQFIVTIDGKVVTNGSEFNGLVSIFTHDY